MRSSMSRFFTMLMHSAQAGAGPGIQDYNLVTISNTVLTISVLKLSISAKFFPCHLGYFRLLRPFGSSLRFFPSVLRFFGSSALRLFTGGLQSEYTGYLA